MTLLGALVCLVAVSSGPEVELLHFESPNCVHCRTMDPTVERLAKAGHAIRHIDTSEDPDTAEKFQVRGVPCFIVLVNGKEGDRHQGTASYDRLNSMIAEARRAAAGDADEPTDPPTNARRKQRGPEPTEQFVSTGGEVVATASPAEIRQLALNSTVRIRIEDRPGQVSYGTGTIIDTRNNHALIITCGHLFRDSGKKGRVTVDAIVDGAKRTIDARVLDYDLEYEIGLLVMSPGGAVQAAGVADQAGQPVPGQPLFSVGCSAGADPSIMEMQVTAIDRFTGAPNIKCTGSPVQGRSGGGLFNEAGQLVAVCFGALGGEARGAYSGLPTVHWLLTKHNLAQIFESKGSSKADAKSPQSHEVAQIESDDENSTATITEDRIPLTTPKSKAAAGPKKKSAGKLVEAENHSAEKDAAQERAADLHADFTPPQKRTRPQGRPKAEALTDEQELEPAPLKRAAQSKAGVAESRGSKLSKVLDEHLAKMDPSAEEADMICIYRPKGSPSAKHKVLILENPSPEFLTRLNHERHAQELFSSLPARKPAPTQLAKGTRPAGTKQIAMLQSDAEERE